MSTYITDSTITAVDSSDVSKTFSPRPISILKVPRPSKTKTMTRHFNTRVDL